MKSFLRGVPLRGLLGSLTKGRQPRGYTRGRMKILYRSKAM